MSILDGIVLPTIAPESIMEAVEEEDKEARRQERVRNCGMWVHRCDPNTGRYRSLQITCGYWRECPSCFEERVNLFTLRYARCLNQCEKVRVIVGTCSTKRKLRRMGIEYWAIPTEGGGYVIIHDGIADLELPEVVPDWEVLARTPEHKRYSGNLGKEEVIEEEEVNVSFVVPVRQFSFEGTNVSVSAVIGEAQELTSDLNPSLDEDEIRWAMWQKATTLREVILKHNGKILSETICLIRVTDKSYKGWGDRNKVTIPEIELDLGLPGVEQFAFEFG